MRYENRYRSNVGALSQSDMETLKMKKACVVGCGGVGGYVIELLGRIGAGYITAVDGDVFNETGLNRQLLCDEKHIGKLKALAAKERMHSVNSEVLMNAFEWYMDENNGARILDGHDVVIDALDDMKGRRILQKTCSELGIPLVHGAISGWYGRVTTIMPQGNAFAILYPEAKGAEQVSDEGGKAAGGLSFSASAVASVQAAEAVKVMLGKGDTLNNKILTIDLLNNQYDIIDFE